MTTPDNTFKRRLSASQQQIGGWCMSGSATIAEAMAYVGYDFIVLDLEHGPSTTQDALPQLRAVEQTDTSAVIRMASHDPTAIKQILDLGAQTLYFPFVEAADQARAIVNTAFYQPQGQRGFAKMHRASRYTTWTDYTEVANEALCLIAQLETPEALELCVEIGGVSGVSAVFIGPADLSSSMGLPGQISHPDVRAKMSACAQQCLANEIPIGTVMPSPGDAHWAFKAGFSFVSIANDLANLMNSCRTQIAALKTDNN